LSLKYIPISQAELFDNNAKLHNLDQSIESIARYGFKSAAKWESTLNGGRGGIVAGNGRVEALRVMEERGDDLPIGIAQDTETGEWCLPVLFGVEASSEVIARAYALDDNNLTLLGGNFAVADLMKLYDQELLLSELEELSKYDEIPVSIGESNLEELLSQLAQGGDNEPEPEYGEDDPTVPEGIQVREGVELGSIWALGRHRIMCSDSTVEENVRELLGDRFDDVGMVWADAPYGINFDPTKNRTKPFGSDSSLSKKPIQSIPRPCVIGDTSIATAVAAFKICNKMANQFWWGANHYASELPPSSCWIVWDKENSGDFADCELAWTNQDSAVRIFRHMWNGCIKDSEKSEKRVHATQKPIALCEWAFEKYGQSNDLIFDPFLGSAPSIIAAERMEGDRTVFGMELSLEYTEIILQRFEKFTGIPAKRIN
ncbi:DNA methyltransferase, partial [Microcoleus sp. Pol12B5]|uniref:DNA methyltransferase n=1 Tax=Microcoleus sp. Pol12B5 TaxID=3055396 RepID=UPI002FD04EAF